MKLLIVCQFYYPENFVIYKIAEELVKNGHDVTVLTGKPNYGYDQIIPEYKDVNYEELNGVKVHRVDLYPRQKSRKSIIKNYLSFWKNSKKWVRNTKEKFDVVYSMSLSPVTILSAGNLYKKKHHVRHVVHCVDLWPESVLVTHAVKKNSLTYRILYAWSKKLYKQADEILIGSPTFKEYFEKVLKLPVDNIYYVAQPSLVETNDGLRKPLGPGFHILYCGNLGLLQQIELIPQAMKLVKSRNVTFHVIGMGPKTEELKELINKYHLKGQVIYHGPLPAKKAAPYFKACDVSYISLKEDGYVGRTIPNKIMMSMAFKKPILCVAGGDSKDLINDAKCGICVKANAEDIAKAIDQFASMDEDKLKEMANNSKNYYFDHFSVKQCVEQITSYLEK